MDFLAEMEAASWERVPDEVGSERPQIPALGEGPFRLIAEIKLRSPAEGSLGTGGVAERAAAYRDAGAAAISVLTEPSRFDGSMADLAQAVGSGAPCMRKDFLVDPQQVWEARAVGASGVLLIARLLDEPALRGMLDAAAEAGMFVLLEAFDADDLARCRVPWDGVQPLLIGVNCRDLRTLAVDPHRFERLAAHLPPDRDVLAESGVNHPEDAARLARWGYRGVLVGTALMRAPDPAGRIRELIAAGVDGCA